MRTTPRGMTLLELMVAGAIGAIVMVGITQAFLAQTQTYQAQVGRRDAQSSARAAISFVEDKLRNAGYGVDPHLAIMAFDSFDAAANAVAGATNFPDAIVVHQRDPAFKRIIAPNGATASSLTFFDDPADPPNDGPLIEPLPAGQILLAICAGGTQYAYVTLNSTASAGTLSVAGFATGAADELPTGLPGTRYRDPDSILDRPCFDSGEAVVVKVDRYAFYVAAFDEDGDPVTPRTPYLMLHRGTDINADGAVNALDAVPVAAGVEQLQVAYVMNRLNNETPVVLGAGATVPAGFTTAPPPGATWDTAATRPKWTDAYNHQVRRTSNPANIRQVRVSFVTRSGSRNAQSNAGDNLFDSTFPAWSSGDFDGTTLWRQMENLAAAPAADFNPSSEGYVRSVMRLSVAPKNLLSRSQFLPPGYGG